MSLSAELRWFWSGRPHEVVAWFVDSIGAMEPSGGHGAFRIDRYLPETCSGSVSIKQRGSQPGTEIKGLVSVAHPNLPLPFFGQVETWLKWVLPSLHLPMTETIAIRKMRRMRKFAVHGSQVHEIELSQDERPARVDDRPTTGCNLELTHIEISGRGEWWSLGFEAFDDAPGGEPRQVLAALLGQLAPTAPDFHNATSASYPSWLAQSITSVL